VIQTPDLLIKRQSLSHWVKEAHSCKYYRTCARGSGPGCESQCEKNRIRLLLFLSHLDSNPSCGSAHDTAKLSDCSAFTHNSCRIHWFLSQPRTIYLINRPMRFTVHEKRTARGRLALSGFFARLLSVCPAAIRFFGTVFCQDFVESWFRKSFS